MSFQGDVAGIGLAELLQSIARGRREGVLTLSARGGLKSTLGLQGGVLYFLPEPDEDPKVWKDRARQAYIADHDVRIDAVRMAEIARAHRIEMVYKLLDAEGVHFRFDTGPLPDPGKETAHSDDSADSARMPQVHCEGIAVEFLLLEYARISDEAQSLGGDAWVSSHWIPRFKDAGELGKDIARFAKQCDGKSSIAEIADRLAWPIRQVRLTVLGQLQAGTMRFSMAREILVLAQSELSKGHITRAASRLSAWVQLFEGGPLGRGDAELLEAEWKADRFSPLLNRMPTREARLLLRRLDHALGDPALALKHWREFHRLHKHDHIAHVHRIACEFRCGDEEELTPVRELLDVARGFREHNQPRRAAAVLRLAAAQQPSSTPARLDVGMGMLAAGMPEEATPWILDVAEALIEDHAAEKALAPLRALIDADPGNREARRLWSRARSLTVRRQLIKKHSLVGFAILMALSLGAWVQIRNERTYGDRLAEVSNLLPTPAEAQMLLDEYFPDDNSPQVSALRDAILDRRREGEIAHRAAWYDQYKEAQTECTLGDAQVGLERALALPSPPRLTTIKEPWPLPSDLYNGLAARLENDLHSLGELELDDAEQIAEEDELSRTLVALTTKLTAVASGRDTGDLKERVVEIGDTLRKRDTDRAVAIKERTELDLITRQNMMLASARTHRAAGSLDKALKVYEDLLAIDESGKLARLLDDEVSEVRTNHETLQTARALAKEGRHAEARARLAKDFKDPEKVALPWVLDSFPAGAIAHMPDGAVHHTPFQLESRPGERLEIRIESPGCEPSTIVTEGSADRFVWLSRTPERRWQGEGRVEAPPVAAGQDQIVCDRAGHIARLSSEGDTLWDRRLSSLGGLARSPVFLPKKPGHLLLLTEDGEAWILDGATGDLEGPWPLGSGPVEGPTATSDGVVARLRDGRFLLWERRLKPTPLEENGAAGLAAARFGSEAGLSVLRRDGASYATHESPWCDWTVSVEDEVYRVHPKDDPESGFAVLRQGEWSFLAWEAPHARLKGGRLWISDENGLRAFTP
ncbi:MAG: DUF4388 domain-containing protein [Planctomycetes bacterium]|nr:DUF4388 domain-containing protein [Planctomycetota bacterium]MCB9904239.1 DUF4388 domain-containing protein [Planctomycetota bacterium]